MTIYFISLNKNILVKTCFLNLNLSIKFLFHPSILPPSSTVNNFDGIFVDRPSWARAIVGTRYVSIESGKWSTRANRFLTVLIIRVRFSFLRERGSIYRYAEDIFIPLASSVRRALDEKRNGEGGGGRRGKEGGKKWNGLSTRFDFRSGIHCRRHRFTSDIRSSSSLSCAIDSSDFCLRILARHSRTQGVPLNPYLRRYI